jgi:hypothetical protein
MSEPDLTAFQISAERAVSAFLQEHHRVVERREVLRGTIPFYSREPQTALRLTAGDLQVLLFDDEASYSIRDRSAGFERAAFKSTDDLLAALMNKLRSELPP